MTIITSIFL